MTADALTRSRDALVGVSSGNLLNAGYPRPIDDVSRLKRWASEVRLQTCMSELCGPINFIFSGEEAVIRHIDHDTAIDTFSPVQIARLTRPSDLQFKEQLKLVLNWASLREDRQGEILNQAQNSAPFWASVINLQPNKKHTIELCSLVLGFALYVQTRIKHAFACPRPAEYSNQVQPIIATPGHGSLPSGHSTEAFMTARVLEGLLGAGAGGETRRQLQRLAARIAANRTVAGVHYPIDSSAGRLLGDTLGEYFLHRCQAPGQANYSSRFFDGPNCIESIGGGALEFNPNEDLNHPYTLPTGAPGVYNILTGTETLIAQSAILQELWALARAEWD